MKTESTEIIGNSVSFPSLSQYLSISNGSGRKGLGKLCPYSFSGEQVFGKTEKIVYPKRLFTENVGPCHSETDRVCEPWLDARFLKKLQKSFLGYLRKLENDLILMITVEC